MAPETAGSAATIVCVGVGVKELGVRTYLRKRLTMLVLGTTQLNRTSNSRVTFVGQTPVR